MRAQDDIYKWFAFAIATSFYKAISYKLPGSRVNLLMDWRDKDMKEAPRKQLHNIF